MDDLKQKIRQIIIEMDKSSESCPFNRYPSPPRTKPCPDCEATFREGCRKQTRAELSALLKIRTLVQ